MELEEEDYQAAIRAHQDDLTASVKGDLRVNGNSYRLDNINNFSVQKPHF